MCLPFYILHHSKNVFDTSTCNERYKILHQNEFLTPAKLPTLTLGDFIGGFYYGWAEEFGHASIGGFVEWMTCDGHRQMVALCGI